jgi:hypothetical protein
MSRQRPNAEASRKVSWIDPRRPSVRASPSTFATDKAVRRDTVIGKRISGPLACSARRITDLRRLFRRDLAITMMTHRCRVLRKIRCGDGESRIVGVGGRTLPHGPREAPESYAPGLLVLPALLGRQAWLNDEPAKSILPLSFVMQTMSEITPANRTWRRQPSSVENDPLRKWSALRASAIDLRIVR